MCGELGWLQIGGNAPACAIPLTLTAMEPMVSIRIVKQVEVANCDRLKPQPQQASHTKVRIRADFLIEFLNQDIWVTMFEKHKPVYSSEIK